MKNISSIRLVEIGLLGFSIFILAACGFGIWYNFKYSSESTDAVALSLPTDAPAPAHLILNNEHTREGGVITVDPSKIGKNNPFTTSN